MRNTLATVTMEMPSFQVSLSENRLEVIVPLEMTVVRIPMQETGTFSAA